MTLHPAELKIKKRLVEMVIPMIGLSGCNIPDPVVEGEGDEDFPMPPENTQIILAGAPYGDIAARDKDTKKGYFLDYDEKTDKYCWREQ